MNRAIHPPRLYAVTDLRISRRSSHVEIVRELLAGGCRWIQIREKSLPDSILLEQLRQCRAFCEAVGAVLLVNDRVDLAWASDAPGIHLGQQDLAPRLARRLLGPDCIIGKSASSVEQAAEAEADPDVDYVAIGPIYGTLTKPDCDPPVGLEGLISARRIVSKPIVAIGGIDEIRARDIFQTGCDSVAVISALMGSVSIASRTAEFLRELDARSFPA